MSDNMSGESERVGLLDEDEEAGASPRPPPPKAIEVNSSYWGGGAKMERRFSRIIARHLLSPSQTSALEWRHYQNPKSNFLH